MKTVTREELYKEFAEKANHKVGINIIDNAQAIKLRMRLIVEESKEFIEAVNDLYKDTESSDIQRLKAEVLKELADLQYVISGFAATFGLDLEEAFQRVHKSNMTKFEGDIEYDAEGKVMKGKNYKAPNLEDLV